MRNWEVLPRCFCNLLVVFKQCFVSGSECSVEEDLWWHSSTYRENLAMWKSHATQSFTFASHFHVQK